MSRITSPPARTGLTGLTDRIQALQARLPGRGGALMGDPSAAMFGRIRRRLTLWYLAILAGILILAGAALYFGVRQALLAPVPGYLHDSAQSIAMAWQQEPPFDQATCHNIPPDAIQHVPYVACFGPAGTSVLRTQGGVPPAFIAPDLVSELLEHQQVQASDMVNAGSGLGTIERYALVVRDRDGDGRVIGIVQVGIPLEGELRSLDVLLALLLVLGALTLGGAAAGALFPSSRALAPARLAFTRQQAFIADAAHEIRTPLTLMRADAEVLLRGRERLDPDDAELLEDIVAETAHMAALAGNMLTLARLDAGAQAIERDVVDLTEVASAMMRRARALADEKGITLAFDSAGPVLTLGDRALLDHAALILLDNALKYNRPGGGVILHAFSAGGEAVLEVRDTGEGIPPEHLPHLGERFYRVDKARSREQGGAGLGLSIVRGIAVAHGGTLSFASMPGEGTTAILTLPVARALPAAP